MLSPDALLLFGRAGTDLTQPLFEVTALVVFEDFLLEVGPVKLGVRFGVYGAEHPLKEIVGRRLAILDLDFL